MSHLLREAQHRHNRAVAVMHFAQARIAKAGREHASAALDAAKAEEELEAAERALADAQKESLS